MRTKREDGVALITALLILFLVSAIVVGMSWMVMSDQRLSGNNQDRELAFYGAEAGMEKMTADMGNTFSLYGSITAAQLPAITSAPPPIPGIQFVNALGTSTYQIGCPLFPCTTPTPFNATIQPPSAFAGMQGLITAFTMQVAAQTGDGSEVKLQRQIELVAIPVFQFGVFSNTDLAFFNGPPFDFGGRVHTNGNLWLGANQGPLFLADKVTVSGQIIRTNLENGFPIAAGGDYAGVVSIALVSSPATTPPSPSYSNDQWRPLALTEGSMKGPNVYGALSGIANDPTWTNTVVPAYNGMLTVGAPQLNLISTALGGLQTPVALIRRPDPGELGANPSQFAQRYFTNVAPMTVSLRIMLDDYPNTVVVPGAAGNTSCVGAAMMSLDTVSSTQPTDLAALTNIAKSRATSGAYASSNGYWQTVNTPTITGCIKIELVNAAGVATDVTTEILGKGYRGKNLNPLSTGGGGYVAPPALPTLQALGTQVGTSVGALSACPDPDLNAVIRIERVRDNPSTGAGCGTVASLLNTDYWPNVLFDTREAIPRSDAVPGAGTGQLTAIGDMYYIELDIANLSKWFMGTLGAPDSGASANNVGGYSVYFSDRRGNQVDPVAGEKIASLGYNDFVNPASGNACPNGVMDQGENLESDPTPLPAPRTYGGVIEPIPPINPLTGMQTPTTNLKQNSLCGGAPLLWGMYTSAQEARENPPFFFRHALKLVNGSTISLGTACYGASPNPPCGLTIASENPVYIQGDYNAPGGSLTAAGTVAASVAADAVTLLSDKWNDVNSFISPYYDTSGTKLIGRYSIQTSYRVALIAGKSIPFPQPAGEPEDFGTDGGLHNFIRFLENWGTDSPWSGTSGVNCDYEGSLVSFYYNRQAIGAFKDLPVYSPPVRNYNFDSNFTNGPQWLPPRTPTLRTVNTIGFSQMLMPTQ